MLTELTLTNFRAFRQQKFPLSKLNLFVGANNSGKSSALSAINVLAQTTLDPASGSSPLLLNGPFDNLGTFKDMVHGSHAGTRVKFSLKLWDYQLKLDYKYRTQRREVELGGFELRHKQNPIIGFSQTSDRFDLKVGGRDIEQMSNVVSKRKPRFDGFLPISRALPMRRDFDSDLDDETLELLRNTDRALFTFSRRTRDFFSAYETLSPFRVQPERTYLFSGETADRVGQNGQNAITMLANDSNKRGREQIGFVPIISEWLKRTNISQGLEVRHLTDRHFEVAVIGRDGTQHNICDVGFGVSQVLPVLVSGIQFLNQVHKRTGGLLVVQEPEIHLHPNAQAELGSFFVEIARNAGQVLVETHSDNLVLRVARHVALGDLSPDDVRIFFVEDSATGRKVTNVKISENGDFGQSWPGDFFPQRQQESFALARAATRKSSTQESQLDLFSRK